MSEYVTPVARDSYDGMHSTDLPRHRLATILQSRFTAFHEEEENRITRSVLLILPWTLLRLNGFVSPQIGKCDQGIETHSDRYHRPHDKLLDHLQKGC